VINIGGAEEDKKKYGCRRKIQLLLDFTECDRSGIYTLQQSWDLL